MVVADSPGASASIVERIRYDEIWKPESEVYLASISHHGEQFIRLLTSVPVRHFWKSSVGELSVAERIYARGETGKLESLEEEPFSTEDELQALVADHPEVLDGEQIHPGDRRRWLLITREKGISESPQTGARWSLDHLIVDQDAVPTLVEVKRGTNPEIRRTIVGQMLEYASHAVSTWTGDELRRTFEETCHAQGDDPEEALEELLQTGGDPDADGFWRTVATNLAARKLRLLFVSDEIPDPLQRVVEFLNEQMSGIEVLAVEVKQFRNQSMQTVVPRVLGRTAKASGRGPGSSPPKLRRETFLECFDIAEVRGAAARLLDVAEGTGATLGWFPRAVSIRAKCSRWQQPFTVSWLYTPSLEGRGWMRTREFSFGVGILDHDPGPDEELRGILQGWAESFRDDPFTNDASSKGVDAWWVDYAAAAQNIDLLAERLTTVLADLKAL